MQVKVKKILFIFMLLFIAFLINLTATPEYSGQWPVSIFPDIPYGNIKKIKESAYFVNNERSDALENDYFVDYIFNKQGYIVKVEYSNVEGSKTKSIEYVYKDGHLVKKIESYPNVIHSDSEIFDITDKGLILTAEKKFSSGIYGWRYKNTFNEKGQIIKTEKFDKYWKWKLVYSKIFIYNDAGLLIFNESLGMNGEILSKDEYYYDNFGNIKESVKYNYNNEIIVIIKNQYDNHGNYLRREFFDKDGNSYAVYSYAWNYDSVGNWTTKILGRESVGAESAFIVPESIIIREIEYCD